MSGTVILAVDLLNQFFGKGMNCSVPVVSYQVRSRVAALVGWAMTLKMPVVHSVLRFTPDQAAVSPMCCDKRMCGPLCVEGDEGAELIPELGTFNTVRAEGGIVVPKQVYDGFNGTDLEAALRRVGAERLLFCGVQTHVCVMDTAKSAFLRGFEVQVVEDCCGSPDLNDHQWALQHLQHFAAAQLTSLEVVTRTYLSQ